MKARSAFSRGRNVCGTDRSKLSASRGWLLGSCCQPNTLAARMVFIFALLAGGELRPLCRDCRHHRRECAWAV